ncbi:dihydrouridine synthase [Marinomonas sp. SBI22]|uniref:tRNA dihydrouridine synthase n=1 Tax=unclassified Marinomonas TaxID=196814 RepID=UPI0007AF5698|nr:MULTISPECIES: tRNA-dihydrouridine synthase family protein [unclassified Marinomonas]KZM42924.1 dihydrouridine synthase [Marinomonas sp. SBI22]KZM44494.1 dihydrouridine synthase [Marinomonas sp. SBI8L]
MEGIMEHTMRQLLSKIGGMDYFVSEFVRVTQYPVPAHTFTRMVPENIHQAHTAYDHPVHTQLLGSNPETMASSALNAIQSGATHIDINFGCPAKRVNGHGGGSFLLQSPDNLYEIVSAIRTALPEHIPLSAKIRLGFEDESLLFENVDAIEKAGATKLVIHGRTKKDGYKPPARWEKIGQIKSRTNMHLVANGDIKCIKSLLACQAITGCDEFMIGRGVLENPFVFQEIRQALSGLVPIDYSQQLPELFESYYKLLDGHYDEVPKLGRLKQWCGSLRKHFPVIEQNLKPLRQSHSASEFFQQVENYIK